MLPLISLVAFRRVSRDCLAFLEAHPSQLVPVSLDLSPFHKRIDDDTLISILVTWVLPGLKSSYEAGADGTSCSSATVAPSPPLSANFHSAALRAPGRSEAPRRPLGLSLRNCWSLTNRGIATLGPALPHLRFLDIQGCWDASGPGLASLRNAPGLRSIDLSNCRKIDTAAILALMAGCPNIEDIRLGYCKGLTGDIFAGGRATWCRVKRLNLQRCTGIWDAGFAHWAPAVPSPAPALADVGGEEDAGAPEADAEAEAEMEVFAPGGNPPREEPWAMEDFLTDASITSIAASCSNLRRFSLSFCCALTEAAAGVLANGMPNLTALDLSFCGMAVSDSSLRKLARGLRKLEALGLRGCNRVTEAGLSAVVLSAEEGAAQPPPPPGAAAPDEPEAAAAAAPEQKQRYHFLSLRSLNASQCKDVSPAALSRMAAASRGRWSVTTRPIVDLQQPVAFYGDGSR
ncbi:MAG: hypothetical protein BJ554DRAFT_4620 [Olpidium bornovanus]|uniref:F-box/LRR-repeat protein 15-like leucin rich repeat domain-containing protein n=1 Tax=Olpidium bornovanus TaxID=278681 RepID=A0A8H8DER6_9FUNG|nr:MAG: hypothetical protein BJ554DRAFT_4620 [Olpidium bornovanus]